MAESRKQNSERTAAAQPDARGMISRPRKFDRGDLVYLAYLLLPFRWFVQLGRPLGWLEMRLHGRLRRQVRDSMQRAFGRAKSPRELDRLTREVFEYHQMRSLLLLVAPLMTARGQLAKYFPLRNLVQLDRALQAGKGAIILSSHVNSVGGLLAIILLRQLGYPVRSPMPDRTDSWAPTPFRRLIHRIFGAPTVMEAIDAFHAQFNIRPLLKELNAGKILILVGDGWHSAAFADASFLGETLPFTTGPLGIARAAGVPVVPLFNVGAPHRMSFEFETPFVVERTGNALDDVASAVRFYIGRVEQRMLADIPCWQHWMEGDVFAKMESWRHRSLAERYATGASTRQEAEVAAVG